MVDRSGGQAARGDRPHKPGKTYFKRRSDRHAVTGPHTLTDSHINRGILRGAGQGWSRLPEPNALSMGDYGATVSSGDRM